MDTEFKKKRKILIADDEEMNREILRHIFEDSYELEMAANGRQAVEKVTKLKDELVVILLDLMMPKMNGYQVLQTLHADASLAKIPIVLISSNTDIRITLSCYSIGVADIISKPFINEIVRQRVDNVIRIYQREEMLEARLIESKEKLTEKERQLEEFYNKFFEVVSDIVEFRNADTGNHIERVKGLTQIMAITYKHLYPDDGLTQERVDLITNMSTLHDIGKIAIPDSILLKPGQLTDMETEIMHSHTTRGCDILLKIENIQDSENYKVAYEIVRHHHERYDGGGYPDGLVGEDIPLSAQLVSIADAYDELVNERVYKKAYSKRTAYEMIMNGNCGVFSPKIISCFEQARKAIEAFSDTH